jgi:hypothetical protein
MDDAIAPWCASPRSHVPIETQRVSQRAGPVGPPSTGAGGAQVEGRRRTSPFTCRRQSSSRPFTIVSRTLYQADPRARRLCSAVPACSAITRRAVRFKWQSSRHRTRVEASRNQHTLQHRMRRQTHKCAHGKLLIGTSAQSVTTRSVSETCQNAPSSRAGKKAPIRPIVPRGARYQKRVRYCSDGLLNIRASVFERRGFPRHCFCGCPGGADESLLRRHRARGGTMHELLGTLVVVLMVSYPASGQGRGGGGGHAFGGGHDVHVQYLGK